MAGEGEGPGGSRPQAARRAERARDVACSLVGPATSVHGGSERGGDAVGGAAAVEVRRLSGYNALHVTALNCTETHPTPLTSLWFEYPQKPRNTGTPGAGGIMNIGTVIWLSRIDVQV